MVQMGLNATGLVHVTNLGIGNSIEEFEVGDFIFVEILKIDEDKKKFALKIVSDE